LPQYIQKSESEYPDYTILGCALKWERRLPGKAYEWKR
jgi:hypothetical protein